MEKYHYEPISAQTKENNGRDTSWAPFMRQVAICSGGWATLFVSGLSMGATTVMVAQWRRDARSDHAVSEEMSSWLTCGSFYIAPLWAVLWTVLTKHIGRKIPFGLAFLIMLIGFIVYYNSTSFTHLLISELLKASGYASNLSVTVLIMTEYASPKYRGLFLTIKAASIMWGMWVANAIGTFFDWTYICIAAFVCFAYSSTMVFWPESPLWLATRGRFDECAENHRWLKGTGEDSERELKNLIETQKEKLRNAKKTPFKTQLINLPKILTKTHFYKPLFISLLMPFQYVVSGKLTSALYAIELIKKMTNDESSAYTVMLILDGVTVFGMYCGCITARYVKRRTQVISTSIAAVCFLFIISLYFCLIDLDIVVENDVVIALLLTAFSVSIAFGPIILCYTLFGELIPTESRTTFTIVGVWINLLLTATYVKTAPYIFNRLSMALTFLIYGICTCIGTVLVYIYLPETKDKTLAEIENIFRKKPVGQNMERIDDVE